MIAGLCAVSRPVKLIVAKCVRLLGSVWVAVNYGGGAPWRWLALWFAFVIVVVSVLLAPHDLARSLFPIFGGD